MSMCVVSRSVAVSVESRGTESQRKVCLQDHSHAQPRRSHQWKVSPKTTPIMNICMYIQYSMILTVHQNYMYACIQNCALVSSSTYCVFGVCFT